MRAPKMAAENQVSGPSKLVLRHEDIFSQILSSEKYDIYTADGLASLESDMETVSSTLGEFKKPSSKTKKSTLGNVSGNIE